MSGYEIGPAPGDGPLRARPRRVRLSLLLSVLTVGLGGCTGSLARTIVEPSSGGGLLGIEAGITGPGVEEFRSALEERLAGEVLEAPAPDGTPIRLMVLEPGDYGLEWDVDFRDDGFSFNFRFDARAPDPPAAPDSMGDSAVAETRGARNGAGTSRAADAAPAPGAGEPVGTVVFLHGLYAEGAQLLPQALRFAEAGYRAVLVDLRAHGRSGGRFTTFGVKERRDVVAVLDSLAVRGTLAPPVHLYGASLGAAVALQAVAVGADVDGVVAVAPFADARELLVGAGRSLLPGWLRPLISEARIAAAADEAEELAGFSFRDAATEAVAADVDVPVLLVHARGDGLVPFGHAERLHRRLPCGTLHPVEDRSHVSLMLDPEATVETVLAWLAEVPACRPRAGADGPTPSRAPRRPPAPPRPG